MKNCCYIQQFQAIDWLYLLENNSLDHYLMVDTIDVDDIDRYHKKIDHQTFHDTFQDNSYWDYDLKLEYMAQP